MSPRFTQNAQGGGESALIPVTPRRDRISSATVPGRRRGTVALVTSALREEERGLLILLGLWPEFGATTPGRRRGAAAMFKRSREEERSNLISFGPFWCCARYDDTREEERYRRSSWKT